MADQEEIARVVRRFDEIANAPAKPPPPPKSKMYGAIMMLILVVIIVIVILYVKKHGMPVKLPFGKKGENSSSLAGGEAPSALATASPDMQSASNLSV